MKRITDRAMELPTFFETLESAPRSLSALRCYATVENQRKISEFTNLTHLHLLNGKKRELLDLTSRQLSLETLTLYNFQIEDLETLGSLAGVKNLILIWNTKASKLWNIKDTPNLEGLALIDFPKLNSLDDLHGSLNLKELHIGGGINQPIKVETLEPLRSLQHLEYLNLSNIRVKTGGILPISSLTNLKELGISNQFPTDEYAKLAAVLPHTVCEKFSPYIRLVQPLGDKDVLVVGRRKPFLNSVRDAAKLKVYENKFLELKERAIKEKC